MHLIHTTNSTSSVLDQAWHKNLIKSHPSPPQPVEFFVAIFSMHNLLLLRFFDTCLNFLNYSTKILHKTFDIIIFMLYKYLTEASWHIGMSSVSH